MAVQKEKDSVCTRFPSPGAKLHFYHTETTRQSNTPHYLLTKTKKKDAYISNHNEILIRFHLATFGFSTSLSLSSFVVTTRLTLESKLFPHLVPLYENVVGRRNSLPVFRTLRLSRSLYPHLGIDIGVLGPRHTEAASPPGV